MQPRTWQAGERQYIGVLHPGHADIDALVEFRDVTAGQPEVVRATAQREQGALVVTVFGDPLHPDAESLLRQWAESVLTRE